MVVAAVVLVLTLGSLVAAGLSLLTAFMGVAIAFGLVSALAVPLGLTSTVAILALMLGLAVGIDYALFITSRFREERARGSEPEEAAGRAVGTAGSAVVFAGATVFIALVGLGVVGIPELTKMGMGGAGAVALAVLVALTLVPALFGFFGRRVLSRTVRKATRPGKRAPAPDAHRARHPLGAVRAAPAGGRADGRRTRSRRRRPTGAEPRTRAARRRVQAGGDHPAPRLRPAVGRLRPRLQRPVDRGRGHMAKSADPEAATDLVVETIAGSGRGRVGR